MRGKLSLEPTAALVIGLAGKFYEEDELTSAFVKQLDLSSGQRMIDDYRKADIYDLTRELISNRKFIVREAVLDAVRKSGSQAQVLILAAGKAPLALELLSREQGRISKVYEVDMASLDEKRELYRKLAPRLADKIQFFQGDIRSKDLHAKLANGGFAPSLYSIIVLEGITHYMTEKELEETLRVFVSPSHDNRCVVIDFGPPYESIAPRIRPLAREAYRIIEDNCYQKSMTKHSANALTEMFHNIGGNVLCHYTISHVEKIRTGKNQYFPEANSGWLEYLIAHI